MNKKVLFVMCFVCFLIAETFSSYTYAAENVARNEATELNLVGKVYIGEFKFGSSEVTPEMRKQIMEGLSRAPKGEYSVCLYSYTDNSGSQAANQVLAVERAKAIKQAFSDFTGNTIEVIDTQALIYKKRVNEVNGRFGIIEFWSPSAVKAGFSKIMPEDINNLVDSIEKDAVGMLVWQSDVEERLEGLEELTKALHKESRSNANDVKSVKNDLASFMTLTRIWLAMLAVLLGLMLYGGFRYLKSKKSHSVSVMPTSNKPEILAKVFNKVVGRPVENKDTTLIARLSDGVKYKVRCVYSRDEYGNCAIVSPFFNKSGKAIVTDTRKKMGQSLANCMVNPEFANQKEKLMAENVIERI